MTPYRPPQNAFGGGSVPAAPPLPPGPVNATAHSGGSSPFGNVRTPDLSGLSPQQIQHISDVLGNLTYSAPLGGYLYKSTANDPNSAFVKGYYGHPMTGGQEGANRDAAEIYDLIGQQPTMAGRTTALTNLQTREGITPTHYPSLNEILGPRGPYGGPFTTPLYNPFQL